MDSDILTALESLARFLVQTFGPDGTILLLLGIAAIFIAYRVYANRAENKALEELKRVYEDRIRVLEARESQRQRVELLQRGMSAEEIDSILGPPPLVAPFSDVGEPPLGRLRPATGSRKPRKKHGGG